MNKQNYKKFSHLELEDKLKELKIQEMRSLGVKKGKNVKLRNNLKKETARIKTEMSSRKKQKEEVK